MSNNLFNILDGIITSDYADENLADTSAIINYAEASGETITVEQAEKIAAVGKEWKHKIENGEGTWSLYRDQAEEALKDAPIITWTAKNNSTFLNGEREADSVTAAVRAGRHYVRNELYGEGVLTIFEDGQPIRQDRCDIFTGGRWKTNTDL